MLPVADVIPTRTRPWASLGLVVVHALVFGYAWLLPREVFVDLVTRHGFVPAYPTFLTASTAIWLHESLLHVGGNVLALWILGPTVEDRLGHVRYLGLYVAGGYAGWLADMWAGAVTGTPLVGASGAVAAILGAHVTLFPRSRVLVLIPVDLVEVPALAFIVSWFVLQVVGGLGQMGPIGAPGFVLWVPLGGLLTGLAFARLLQRPERRAVEWWS